MDAPTNKPVMKQLWRHLLFLHWEVPAEVLQARLPPGLAVDTFEGRAYVGLVPFTMSGVRPPWAPALPWISHFEETNVRTYVRHREKGPGVWFFSLDAANPLACLGARVGFSLPYFYARMQLAVGAGEGGSPTIEYQSRRLPPGPRPATCALRYRPTGEPSPAAPGTLEHFLVERYTLYTVRAGSLRLGRVRHLPYPVQGARIESVEESLIAAAGIARPDAPPLAHYARGVDVDIFALERAGG